MSSTLTCEKNTLLHALIDGLYASVFSSNLDTALRVARSLEAGNVGVNCTSPFDCYELPFGGYKASGFGRSKGSDAVLSWLEEKSVYIRHQPTPWGDLENGL